MKKKCVISVIVGLVVFLVGVKKIEASPATSSSLGSLISLWKKPKSRTESNTYNRRHVADIPYFVKPTRGKSRISKIVHQSWKTDQVDPSVKPWQDSWKEQNPGWTYILWTDEMNRKLVERHYPWFLETYDNFPEAAAGILRADSVRYMYMHHYGGVYADLDFRALKPMNDLFGDNEHLALAGRISDDEEDDSWENNVPNAWMASSLPGHPLWLMCLVQVMKRAVELDCEGPSCFLYYQIERTTGPMLFRQTIIEWQRQGRHPKYRLELLPAGWIYPIDWRKMYDQDHVCYKWYEQAESKCYKRFPDAFAITYWSHIWDIHHRDDDEDR